jgi:hypothetical protein
MSDANDAASTPTRRYTIHLTKEDMAVELASDDVEFIAEQMNRWFKVFADDSIVIPSAIVVPTPPPPAPTQPPVATVPEPPPPTPAPVQPVEAAPPQPEPVAVAPEIPATPAPSVTEPPVVHAPAATPESVPPATKSVPAPVSDPLPDLEPVVITPQPQPVAEPQPATVSLPEFVTQPAPSAAVEEDKDDFESVLDTILEDLEESPELPPIGQSRPIPQAPAPEAAPMTIDSLTDLVARSSSNSPEDSLLLTAYYLTYFEGEEKFSLKRVNSLMVKSGLKPVNHSVLESALTMSMVEMVPDLTGHADVTEYTLTTSGQSHTQSLISI